MNSKKKILCVGLCCFDIISLANGYPLEDSDQRCIALWKQRGGNASTNCTVLSMLNTPCEFFGTVGTSEDTAFLLNDFAYYGIDTQNCVIYKEHGTNTSSIVLNKQNGSTTILYHQTSVPELNCNDFLKLDLCNYKWIHFEGRSTIKEVCKMIDVVRKWNQNVSLQDKITISVEAEKPRESYKEYLDKGDYVFISKDFARMMNCNNMQEAVNNLSEFISPSALIICAWAEEGAAAKIREEETVYKSPAFVPTYLVNTLGAGDVFIAAMISQLSKGNDITNALVFACKVAGDKCAVLKTSDLKDKLLKYSSN